MVVGFEGCVDQHMLVNLIVKRCAGIEVALSVGPGSVAAGGNVGTSYADALAAACRFADDLVRLQDLVEARLREFGSSTQTCLSRGGAGGARLAPRRRH